METSHFEDGDTRIVLPPDANQAEAAAIVAAIECLLAESDGHTEDEPTVDLWEMMARLEAVEGWGGRPPADVPLDPWVAVNQLPRYE